MHSRIVVPTIAFVCLATEGFAQQSADKETETDGPPKAEYVLESGQVFFVIGEERHPIELSDQAVSILVHDEKLYVALGFKGVALYDLTDQSSPALVLRTEPSREKVIGFVVVDGEVWMRVVSTAVVPMVETTLKQQAPKETPVQKSVQPKPVPEQMKKEEPISTMKTPVSIVEIRPGEVKLNVGTKDDVKVGDRFSVFHKKMIEDEVDEKTFFEVQELAAVIEVTAVNENNSLAMIWRGDRIQKDDIVEPADKDHHTSLAYPRRLANLAEFSIVLRPILDVSTGGIGGLCDLNGTYIGSAWFANVSIQPLGFGFTERGRLFSLIAVGEAGYDSRIFGLGVGAGIAANAAKAKEGWLEDEPPDAPENQGWSEDGTGFVISQVIRLGTRDGLNFTGRNTLIDFEWGGAHGTFDIPLTGRTTLFLEGGGSAVGYAMGAIGVSSWLQGNGDAKSIGLSASAGFAAAWVEREVDEGDEGDGEDSNVVSAIGPMVSIGLDYRFGFF